MFGFVSEVDFPSAPNVSWSLIFAKSSTYARQVSFIMIENLVLQYSAKSV